MSQPVQQNNTSTLSKPAEELLEQYKNYREDGIVEIKEPITSDNNQQQSQHSNKTKDITDKIKQKNKFKNKRSTIINSLNSKKSEPIGGYDDTWWNDLIKAENKTENDQQHKLNNISLIQKYETKKDPSPFNKDNNMNVTKNWDTYLKQETEQIADKYFKKIDKNNEEKNNKNTSKKKSKKKVRFATNLVTKQGSSENVINIQKTDKKSNLSSKKQYGNLVGFFNKKSTNKNTKNKKINNKNNNPYLDKELMKGFNDFTPDKNQSFEHKFDAKNVPQQPTIIESNEFKSMIIPSNEFKNNDKIIENKKLDTNKNVLKKDKNKNMPAFNGRVFERKPPDMVYINDNKKDNKRINIKPQSLPKKCEPKTNKISLFRKRVQMDDKYFEEIEVENNDNNNKKKVRFSENLITKELIISENDKYMEKEDIYLLFLDVDGVLNCSYSPSLSRSHILRLKKILNRIKNCKICVSSSWRIYKQTRIKLLNGLKEFGEIDVNNIVIGYTPKIQKDAFKFRAEEIKIYLENDLFLNNNYNILNWCAIDDIPLDKINKDYINFMNGHFIKINPSKGLTDYDIEKIICLLTGVNEENTQLESINEENMNEMEKNMQLEIINKKKEKIKILFLDVDGVLNYNGFDDGGVNCALCNKCLLRLKTIVDKTDCRIVLSTSWRRIPCAKEQLLKQLSYICNININKYIIGDTPVLGSEIKKSIEIYKYLENIKNKYDIISWIAIDDMSLDKMGTNKTKQIFKNHFVKTDIKIGLSNKNVDTAVSILNNKF